MDSLLDSANVLAVDPLTGLLEEPQPLTTATPKDTALEPTTGSGDSASQLVTADTSDDESLANSASAISGLSLGDWLNQCIAGVWSELSSRASEAGFLELLSEVYGGTATDPQAFTAAAQSLAQRLSNGDRLGLRFELETGAEMAGIAGAYAAVGDNGVATIYINGTWLQSASAEQLRLVLLEEIGHAFDTELNGDRDTAGDEGELFAALLTEDTVISAEMRSAILADNDAGWLWTDGQQIAIEKAAPTYIFSENFANNSQGWTLGVEWQIGSATTSSGHEYAGPDPGLDNSSTSDNGVAGVVIGGNASTAPHDYYYLTSPTFNTATAIQPKLSYFRWLNSDYTPFMQNTIDIYNGSTWTNIWSSGGIPGINDTAWTQQSFDITLYKSASTRIRFGFKTTSGVYFVSSWNIDDVTVFDGSPIATNLSTAETYTEDTPLNLTDIVISDVDSANITVTLTLSNLAAGTLSTGTSGAVTSTFVNGIWTASGAIANVNALLAALVFTPSANYNSTFSIATRVSDGAAPALIGTKIMTGIAVNDAPTTTNLSAAEAYTEDTPLNLTDIVVSDIDSPTVTVTLTLSNLAAGTLSTGTSGAVTSTFVNGVWTASGAIANVNALLAALVFAPSANYNSTFSIATWVSDGVAAPLTGSKTMTGIAVNDAPTATNAAAALAGTVTEAGNLDNGTVVAGTASASGTLTASDVDAGATRSWSIIGIRPTTYGTIAINSSTGDWSYTLNNSNAATQALKEGETVIQTYTARVTDDFGAYADQTITITINGTNDIPVIEAAETDTNGFVTEDDSSPVLSDSGKISFSDFEIADNHTTSVTKNEGSLGGSLVVSSISTILGTQIVYDNGSPNLSSGYFASSNYSYTKTGTLVTTGAAINFTSLKWWGGLLFREHPSLKRVFHTSSPRPIFQSSSDSRGSESQQIGNRAINFWMVERVSVHRRLPFVGPPSRELCLRSEQHYIRA